MADENEIVPSETPEVLPEIPPLPEEKKEFRNLADLKEWDKNPRTATKEAIERLKRQILDLNNGKPYKPLLVNQDNIVLGGNMRLKVYREMNIDPIEVTVVVTNNESDMFKFALSDNDHVGVTDIDMIINNMPQLDVDWSNYAIDLNNSVLINTLQKYSADDINNEWKDMPEFKQENKTANKQLIINFKDMDDYNKFAELVQQKLTENTRSIWYPAQEKESTLDKNYE